MCREVSGETDLLPGVTGAVGGHSAWLQGLQVNTAALLFIVTRAVTNVCVDFTITEKALTMPVSHSVLM